MRELWCCLDSGSDESQGGCGRAGILTAHRFPRLVSVSIGCIATEHQRRKPHYEMSIPGQCSVLRHVPQSAARGVGLPAGQRRPHYNQCGVVCV